MRSQRLKFLKNNKRNKATSNKASYKQFWVRKKSIKNSRMKIRRFNCATKTSISLLICYLSSVNMLQVICTVRERNFERRNSHSELLIFGGARFVVRARMLVCLRELITSFSYAPAPLITNSGIFKDLHQVWKRTVEWVIRVARFF